MSGSKSHSGYTISVVNLIGKKENKWCKSYSKKGMRGVNRIRIFDVVLV